MSMLLAAFLLFQNNGVEQLIEKLRSDKVEERNQAARELKKCDESALPALEKAARDADVEVSRAAAEILKDLKARFNAQSAEAAFRKIEETIAKAKTLKVKFTYEKKQPGRAPEKTRVTGEIWVRQPRSIRFDAQIDTPDKQDDLWMVCDGTGILKGRKDCPYIVEAPWPNLGERVALGFLRAGCGVTDMIVGYPEPGPGIPAQETDPRKLFTVSDFQMGPDEGEARTILFRVAAGPRKEVQESSLVYDPRTFRLLRRTMKVQKIDREEATVLEQYEEFTLNADLPDDKFRLLPRESTWDAKVFKARCDVGFLGNALGIYELDCRKFPTTEEGLSALHTPPKDEKKWRGPYVEWKGVPLDPWGNPYVYRRPGVLTVWDFDLFSCGADGKPGTDDDIVLFKGNPVEEKKK